MTKEEETFDTTYSVPLECQSCVDSVQKVLNHVPGIEKIDISLENNIVSVTGSTAPSQIVRAIQSTGKDAIIRGTGKPNSAAVCILESFDPKDSKMPVKGLARIVSVNDNSVMIDLTVNGLRKGMWYPSLRASGDLSRGALSTGSLFYQLAPVQVEEPSNIETKISSLGAFENNSAVGLFAGQSFLKASLKIHDLIGRSVVLSPVEDRVTSDSLCGVIARSAGVWENDKQVCSCTGKTVWQERTDAVSKGIN